MSYRYERRRPERRPERRRGRGCLVALVVLVWVVLLGLLAYRYWIQPQISQYIGNQLGEQIRSQVGGQIQQGAQDAVPTVVAALPSGELRISEAEANQYFAAQGDNLRPIESVQVRFVPGEVQADIGAMNTLSTARMGLAVQDGRVMAVDPRIEGPLGQVISLPDLTRALEQQFNDQLASQGRRATDIRVEQGVLVVNIEN